MDTIVIIVLGALILIVVIAIIVILIKGKDPESEESLKPKESGKTFKQSLKPDKDATQKSDVTTPQLHQKQEVPAQPAPPPTPPPTPQSPAMNNITTPQQTPSAQTATPPTEPTKPTAPKQPEENISKPKEASLNQPTQEFSAPSVGQSQDMYKPNPLPNESQIDNDMANLENSMKEPNTSTIDNTSSEEEGENLAKNLNNSLNQADGNNTVGESTQSNQTISQSPPIAPNQAIENPNIANKGDANMGPETPTVPPVPPQPTPTEPSETPPAPQEVNTPKPVQPINPENPNSPIHTPPQDNPVTP